MIIAFDPGYKKVAWASYINEEFKVGYVHRGKHERIKYMDVVIVEDQYIKRVSRRLQAAVAASVIKVRKAASEIETMAHLAGAEVIQCHPKTWQTIIKTPVGTKAVKKASKELAEYLLGKGRIGQDICDATCMLYWYITKRSTK
jgi:hypothetical protein